MLSAEQIRRIAREENLSAGVVEKDYVLTWLLKGMYSVNSVFLDDFVLKGGTAIRKVYFSKTWRFSEDLDFTVVKRLDSDKLREAIKQMFDELLDESGINFSLETFHPTAGSIIASAQFVGPLQFTNRIKHDISLKEKMVLDPERHIISTNYSDLHEFEILTYSLKEILAEKIRSIMQRGYSRDYYDVWRLLNEKRFNEEEIKRIVKMKCELNHIEYNPNLLFDKKRLGETRIHWEKGLRYLTRELPDFEMTMKEVKEKLEFLLE